MQVLKSFAVVFTLAMLLVAAPAFAQTSGTGTTTATPAAKSKKVQPTTPSSTVETPTSPRKTTNNGQAQPGGVKQTKATKPGKAKRAIKGNNGQHKGHLNGKHGKGRSTAPGAQKQPAPKTLPGTPARKVMTPEEKEKAKAAKSAKMSGKG